MPINKILLKNIVQDKIDELKQSTIDSAARKRTAQLRDRNFKGEEVPIYKAGTKEQIGTRRKPGKGVIQLRLQGREESPGKPAIKPLYKKITPGATGRAKRQDASHQPVYDRMAEMLIERNLVRDLYKGGKGLVGGLLGTQKDRRDKSKIYRFSRVLGSTVGTPARFLGKTLVGAGKTAVNFVKGASDLSKTMAAERIKSKQSADASIKAAEERTRLEQERKAAEEHKKKMDAYAAHSAAYESTSYRDIMLQKIAEMRLVEKLPKGENINEWVWMIPWAVRAGQLGLSAYRAYRGAKALKTAYNVGKTAYGAARAIGAQGALRQGLSTAGKSLLGSAAKETGKAAATTAADKALGVSSGVKKYVGKKAMKSLAPDAKQVYSGVSKGLSGLSTATRATNSATGDSEKSKKPTRQEEPDDSIQADHAYSRARGYNPIGDDDDDQ